MINIPLDYTDGFEKAKALNEHWAKRYVEHSLVGDPAADRLILALEAYPKEQGQAWIQQGIEVGPKALADAPDIVREFFTDIEHKPDWWDPENSLIGCRAFHKHSEMFIAVFVAGVLLEGFSTLIAKSFAITGRLRQVEQGVERMKQNNRHLVEIFMPGGLDRQADGWKLSIRIRLVHARVRLLMSRSDEWNHEAWGTPLSASHIAFANCTFSSMLLKRSAVLGVHLSEEERKSFMMVWRYSGQLLGVAPDMLFKDYDEALLIQKIGTICEPPPGVESCQLANGLVNAAPVVAGIVEPDERRKLTKKIYRISRSLIGDELADQLRFPPGKGIATLAKIRLRNRFDLALRRHVPAFANKRSVGQFKGMLDISHFDSNGFRYQMPAHVHAEKDSSVQ